MVSPRSLNGQCSDLPGSHHHRGVVVKFNLENRAKESVVGHEFGTEIAPFLHSACFERRVKCQKRWPAQADRRGGGLVEWLLFAEGETGLDTQNPWTMTLVASEGTWWPKLKIRDIRSQG